MDNSTPHNGAPPTLDHVVGQKRAVRQLKTALDAYFNDRSAATADMVAAFFFAREPPSPVPTSLMSPVLEPLPLRLK